MTEPSVTLTLFKLIGAFAAGFAMAWALRPTLFNSELTPSTEPPEEDESDEEDYTDDETGESDDSGEECKMVLVIRQDLKMERGKIAAQCSHATLGAFRRAQRNRDQYLGKWTRGGQAKITLKGDSEEQIMELFDAAQAKGLNAYVVVDAGRTQIPAGSKTVLAIGPDINKVTGKLKLY